jgi:hypothetical protein
MVIFLFKSSPEIILSTAYLNQICQRARQQPLLIWQKVWKIRLPFKTDLYLHNKLEHQNNINSSFHIPSNTSTMSARAKHGDPPSISDACHELLDKAMANHVSFKHEARNRHQKLDVCKQYLVRIHMSCRNPQ